MSVYSHPVLTVLVDDNRSFLDSVEFRLNSRVAHLSFQNPQEALEWVSKPYRFMGEYACEEAEDKSDFFDKFCPTIDLNLIHHMVYRRRRFETPAVLVVDYSMPQMNGVEFFRQIAKLPCKKILLTGHADDEIAVEAFNAKLIDLYLKKTAPDAMPRLEAEISRLQKAFFQEKTGTLQELLSRAFSFLGDQAMIELIEQLMRRYRFVEYYLFPVPQGVLFFDAAGRPTLMVIETYTSYLTHAEVATANGAPAALISALRERRLVPFFSDSDGMYEPSVGNDWISYCLPAVVCHGFQDYYWALFDLPAHYLHGRVYSFEDFLRNRQAA